MINTKITVSKEAVLQGHRCRDGLYRIPLRSADAKALNPLPKRSNIPQSEYNAKTMLVNVPDFPKPKEAIQSVYELRTKQEMMRYYQAAGGFLVQVTWIKGIGNNQ